MKKTIIVTALVLALPATSLAFRSGTKPVAPGAQVKTKCGKHSRHLQATVTTTAGAQVELGYVQTFRDGSRMSGYGFTDQGNNPRSRMVVWTRPGGRIEEARNADNQTLIYRWGCQRKR